MNRHSPLALFLAPALVVLATLTISCHDADPLTGPPLEAAKTGAGAPLGRPSDATAVALSPWMISIGWQDNSIGEFGFEVHISLAGPTGVFAAAATTGANVNTYSDGGLAPETSRCYKVRAVLATAPKLRYTGFSNTTCATTPISPPSMSSYTWPIERPGSGIEVIWADGASNEDGFRIEGSDYGLESWATVGTVGANVTSFMTDLPLCYRVFAFNAGGDSGPSIVGCTAPAAPGNVTLTVLGDGTREVTWTDNSSIEDAYELWVGSGSRCCPGGGMCDAGYYENPFDFLPANTTSYRTSLDSDECQTFTLILMASRRWVQSEPAYVVVP